MDRTEWPTKDKIEALRAQGVVAYSSRATAGVAALIICAIFAGLHRSIGTDLADYLANGSEIGGALEVFKSLFTSAVIIPAVLVSFGTIIFGLLQTKFLFRWANLRFTFSRRGDSGTSFQGRFAGVAGFSLLAILAGFMLFRFSIVELLGLLNNDRNGFALALERRISSVFPFVLAAFLGLSGLSWVLAGFGFKRRHRMSRKELESEQLSRE